MTFSLFVNFNKTDAVSVAKKVITFLTEHGQSLICDATTYRELCDTRITSAENPYIAGDICIALGGDGTIIHTAKKAALLNKPVLGINMGRIGYLAAIETDEMHLLSKLIDNTYSVEKRSMLEITIENGNERSSHTAFNDAVITKGSLSRMIDIGLTINHHSVAYRSDGLIVSTPTGSTAYSLSAGGPVIDPKVSDILITPICAYTGFNRPLIVPSDTKITLRADISENKEAYITVDGEVALKLYKDTAVTVQTSRKFAQLISLKGENGLFNIDKSLKKGVV